MLKNYFKIAIAVLKRRKFFTFISLFGISFTLTILMVAAAFINKVVNDDYPHKKRNRSLYVSHMEMDGPESMNSSSLSYYFITRYVSKMNTPEKIAISSGSKSTNTYVNNRKIVINYRYTNADYWNVLDFKFLEGKAITRQQVDNAERVAVISARIKDEYFGKDAGPVVGKYIEADNVKYRVCGVIKSLPVTTYAFYSDIYLPVTVTKTDPAADKGYLGDFNCVLLAKTQSDVSKMRQEYEAIITKLPMLSKEYNVIHSHADNYVESYFRTGNEKNSGLAIALIALGIFATFVMLLPTLNLVNINITRILERSSEIGVRKAFGASSQTLVYQFIVENLILTFLGGLIGLVLSVVALYFINNAHIIDDLNLTMNFTVLMYAFVICLFFGVISGVYPAWRMSKLNVVTALKA